VPLAIAALAGDALVCGSRGGPWLRLPPAGRGSEARPPASGRARPEADGRRTRILAAIRREPSMRSELRWAMPLAIAALACTGGGGGAGAAGGARGFPSDAQVVRDPANGTIRFLAGPDLARGLEGDADLRAARAAGDPAAIALAFVAAHAGAFRLVRPAEELAVREVRPDREGRRIVVLAQRWRGVPVLRGELRVHVDGAGRIVAVNGSTIPTPSRLDIEPRLDAAAARARAAAVLGRGCDDCSAALVIAPAGADARLAWRVGPPPSGLSDALVIDARHGEVLERAPVALPGRPSPAPEEPR